MSFAKASKRSRIRIVFDVTHGDNAPTVVVLVQKGGSGWCRYGIEIFDYRGQRTAD